MTESSPRFRSGELFAADLRAIREERGVALKDIIDATRLAEDVVEQFEVTALLDNPVFNRVYLRSLVSSYARLIDIDENVALQGLEDTLRGEYEGSLGKIYLGDEPRSSDEGGQDAAGPELGEGSAAPDAAPSVSESGRGTDRDAPASMTGPDADELKEPPGDPDPENEPGSAAHPAGTGGKESVSGGSGPAKDESQDESDGQSPDGDGSAGRGSGKDGADERAPGDDDGGDAGPAAGAAGAGGTVRAPEKGGPEKGRSGQGGSGKSAAGGKADSGGKSAAGGKAASSGKASTRKAAEGASARTSASRTSSASGVVDAASVGAGTVESRKGLLLPDMRGLVAAIVAGVVLIALVWISVAWFLDSPEEPEPEITAPAVDSSRVEPEPPGPEPVSLPDTFEVRVIARDEPLDPIRSRVDDDLRRPYWVELGDTLILRVAERVVLEREVEHALVTVENWLPPTGWLEPDGTYLISRARTQSWLDSLIAAGIFPPEAPDSLDIPALEELRSREADER